MVLLSHFQKRRSVRGARKQWRAPGGQLYELVWPECGRGPRGETVWRARRVGDTPETGEWVQVKMWPASLGPQALKCVDEEAYLCSRLEHPGLTRYHAFHRTEEGSFLVSEAVHGESLERLISRAALRDEPLSERFALWVGARLAETLVAVHAAKDERGRPLNVVHRGVTPENVWLSLKGEVKLLNLGTAWSQWNEREHTSPLRLRGDAAYASPERLLPVRPTLDGRADLFSLGLVLLEMMTCRHLYDMESVERAAELAPAPGVQWRDEQRSWLPATEMARRAAQFKLEDVEQLARNLSEPVQRLLKQLLAREVEERPETAEVVRALLGGHLESTSPGYGAQQVLQEAQRLRDETAHEDRVEVI